MTYACIYFNLYDCVYVACVYSCTHDYYVHSYAYIKATLYDCMYSHHQIDGKNKSLLI